MDRKRSRLQGIVAAIGFLVLIFDSSLALEGARSGIDLCIKTVIPSLFPFFVLSMILTNTLSESLFSPIQSLTGVLRIPKAAAPVLIPAVLGGYPVGAKCVGDFYQNGQLHKKEAERLLAFCSNAGPSFLFGMVSGFFPERKTIWILWLIHIVSAAFTAVTITSEKEGHPLLNPSHDLEQKPIVLSAATAMALVCCWVILFRIILFFLKDWFLWILPPWMQVFLTGILELTNGCCELMLVTDVKLRFVLCACMLSFGGICVLLQTVSVTKGLSLEKYIKGKLLQTVFSFCLSLAIISGHGIWIGFVIPILMVFFRKVQKRYRNCETIPI